MAKLIVPALLRGLCGGEAHIDLTGSTIAEILADAEARCPGLYDRVVEDGRLRPELAFAVDGEVIGLALHDVVGPNAEIAIVPAIGGG